MIGEVGHVAGQTIVGPAQSFLLVEKNSTRKACSRACRALLVPFSDASPNQLKLGSVSRTPRVLDGND